MCYVAEQTTLAYSGRTLTHETRMYFLLLQTTLKNDKDCLGNLGKACYFTGLCKINPKAKMASSYSCFWLALVKLCYCAVNMGGKK